MVLLFYGNKIWTSNRKIFDVSSDNSELKKELRTHYTEVSFDLLYHLEEKIWTWERMKRVMSWLSRLKQILLKNTDGCNYGMPHFITELMTIFVLIGRVFKIVWEMLHSRMSLNLVLPLLLLNIVSGSWLELISQKKQSRYENNYDISV